MSRTLLRALLLGLLLTFACAQLASNDSPQSGESDSTCSFSNLYTRILKSKGVVFRSEPYGTDELCKGEWDTAGSCCRFSSTLDYVELEKAKIARTLQRAFKSNSPRVT